MIKEIEAKSILRRHKKIDSWFLSHYGINLYRGCTHNCAYCDGRTEKYRVEGQYGRDITVKVNAPQLLNRELDPHRKRKPMPKGFMILCGGVSDAYQPVEEKYQLARQALELIYTYNYPVHILTKSVLVLRDLDLLKKINRQSQALICFSFATIDDEIGRIFEPGVPPPSQRLAAIKQIKEAGIACGLYLLPVIPFVSDGPRAIETAVKKAREAGVDFINFGTLTLKEGVQKDHFMAVLNHHFPEIGSQYDIIYSKGSQWGEASFDYNNSAHLLFDEIASSYKVPKRMPYGIFRNLISKDDLIIVILEHLDYLLKINGQTSPYGFAAYSLSKSPRSIADLSRSELLKIKGIGPATVRIILEIITTGRCAYYERLL